MKIFIHSFIHSFIQLFFLNCEKKLHLYILNAEIAARRKARGSPTMITQLLLEKVADIKCNATVNKLKVVLIELMSPKSREYNYY